MAEPAAAEEVVHPEVNAWFVANDATLVPSSWMPAEADGQEQTAHHDMYQVILTADHLDIGAAHLATADARCGGVASFIGVTRGNFEGKIVTRLEYHCYANMAVKQLRCISEAIFTRFQQIHKVVIAHRLGHVPVTEASLVIVVASEHRASGLAAVAWAVDELKATVPIWKREVYCEADAAAPSSSLASWKANKEFGQRHQGATVGDVCLGGV